MDVWQLKKNRKESNGDNLVDPIEAVIDDIIEVLETLEEKIKFLENKK